MTTNGNTPTQVVSALPDDGQMTAEQLRNHNVAEMQRGIDLLHLRNEMRIAAITTGASPWAELQFEMLSYKLDIIVDALADIMSVDKETQMLRYGLHYQVLLSRHLDKLLPEFDFGPEIDTTNNPE